jgi:hypothetical protein
MRLGDSSKRPAVLIVEDAVRSIEEAGFEVIEAANADEAKGFGRTAGALLLVGATTSLRDPRKLPPAPTLFLNA